MKKLHIVLDAVMLFFTVIYLWVSSITGFVFFGPQ